MHVLGLSLIKDVSPGAAAIAAHDTNRQQSGRDGGAKGKASVPAI
jgi:hypothetical protein